jgi:ATP-binding cassette, subfamily B, bacterial PglK
MQNSDIPAKSLFGGLRLLFSHLSPHRRIQFFGVCLLMLGGALAEMAMLGSLVPFLTVITDPGQATTNARIVDTLTKLGLSNGGQQFGLLALLFAATAILAGCIRTWLAWSSQNFIFKLGYDLSTDVYRKSLYQPLSYHIGNNSSELVSGVYKVQRVVNGVLLPLMQALTGIVISVFILAALIAIEARTTFLCWLASLFFTI